MPEFTSNIKYSSSENQAYAVLLHRDLVSTSCMYHQSSKGLQIRRKTRFSSKNNRKGDHTLSDLPQMRSKLTTSQTYVRSLK